MAKEVNRTIRTKISRNGNSEIDYTDDSFIVTARIDIWLGSNHAVRFATFLLVIYREGLLRIDAGGQTIQAESKEVLSCQPNILLDNLWQERYDYSV